MLRLLAVGPALVLALAASAAAAPAPPAVDAAAWAVLDARDDEILGASAGKMRRPVASSVKLMTALAALDRLDPDGEVEIQGYEPGNPAESVAGLETGDRISVEDLLHALLMVSANDAATELAKAAAGSEQKFVALMNRRAEALGLGDTRFANPIGFDDPGAYSTAEDLARLAAELRRDPMLARIVDTERYLLESPADPIELENSNPLLFRNGWVDGVKTGQTLGAGWVLTASGRRGGAELVAVVLGAPSEQAREQAALELLEWGFSRYQVRVLAGHFAPVGRVLIEHSDGQTLPLLAARQLDVRVRDDARVTTMLIAAEPVEGPIGRGKRMGRLVAVVDGDRLASVPVIAARAVGAPSLGRTSTPLLAGALIAIAALVIMGGVAGIRARHRDRSDH